MAEWECVTPDNSPPESEVSRTLRNRGSSRGQSGKFRTPRTLTRQLQQHRDSERDRHRGLNASILEISKTIPGHNQLPKETKIVRLQRLINYICHLETHIQSLCLDLDIDLEFKNLFLTPHITQDTKRALARQTGYDPDMVKGYGDGAATYIMQDPAGDEGVCDAAATSYQVTLPARNMYYCAYPQTNSPSASFLNQESLPSHCPLAAQHDHSESRPPAGRKKRTNIRHSVRRKLVQTKDFGVLSSETSDKETSAEEEDSPRDGLATRDSQGAGIQPKCSWLDGLTLTEEAGERASRADQQASTEPQRQASGESLSDSGRSPNSMCVEKCESTCLSNEGGHSSSCPEGCDNLPTTPSLTESQAEEGRALFHSYAKQGAAQSPCRHVEGADRGRLHHTEHQASVDPRRRSRVDDSVSSSSSDETSAPTPPAPPPPAPLTELRVVEMEDSDEGENCFHGDPFLSSTVLSSQLVRGAQQALKSSLRLGQASDHRGARDPGRTADEMKENIPMVSAKSFHNKNDHSNSHQRTSLLDNTPPKLSPAPANKRKNYTPNKRDEAGGSVHGRSPLSPLDGNVLRLGPEDKPLFEISPSVHFSPSPTYGVTSLRGLLGIEEDPLYCPLEAADREDMGGHMTDLRGHMTDLRGHMTDPRGHMTYPRGHMTRGSPGRLESQDSGLHSQDSGCPSSLG